MLALSPHILNIWTGSSSFYKRKAKGLLLTAGSYQVHNLSLPGAQALVE